MIERKQESDMIWASHCELLMSQADKLRFRRCKIHNLWCFLTWLNKPLVGGSHCEVKKALFATTALAITMLIHERAIMKQLKPYHEWYMDRRWPSFVIDSVCWQLQYVAYFKIYSPAKNSVEVDSSIQTEFK